MKVNRNYKVFNTPLFIFQSNNIIIKKKIITINRIKIFFHISQNDNLLILL